MSSWTLVARLAEKPPERGLVAVDLTIDGGDPLKLSLVEAEGLEAALDNALEGIDNASGRISCVNAGTQIIVAIDKITVASLRYEKAERMRDHLKELLAGNGTEFTDSGACIDYSIPY
jgi:MoaA/NifB/PqqE/SkfB family radical SAM enzyme